MRKVQSGQRWLFCLALSGILLSFSCNQKKSESKTNKYTITEKTSFGESKIPCFTLSSQSLDVWADKSLLADIDHVMFLPQRGADPSTITLTVFPMTSTGKILEDGILSLDPDNSCNAISAYVYLAENYMSLANMGIVQDGKFVTFKSIKLEPFARAADNALAFNYSVDGSKTPMAYILNPCPPCEFCIPPCPIRDSLPDPIDTTLKNSQ